MKKTHIALILCFALLLGVIAVQSNRLERHNSKYAALELRFAEYKQDQANQMVAYAQQVNQKQNQTLKVKNEEIEAIQSQLNLTLATSDRVQNDLRRRLRQAQHSANQGSCEDALDTARVSTELLGELKRRAIIYADQADQRGTELLACLGFYEALEERL